MLPQNRSVKRIVAFACEIISSVGGGMGRGIFSKAINREIERFVYMEIREETTLSKTNLKELIVRLAMRGFRIRE